jgi:diguanylate cyclase
MRESVVPSIRETSSRTVTLKVIAEGVETAEQLAFLQAQGCDEGQGYYFSRPIAADQFAQLLARGMAETVVN